MIYRGLSVGGRAGLRGGGLRPRGRPGRPRCSIDSSQACRRGGGRYGPLRRQVRHLRFESGYRTFGSAECGGYPPDTSLLLPICIIRYRRHQTSEDELPEQVPKCICARGYAERLKGESEAAARHGVIEVRDSACREVTEYVGVIRLELAIVTAADECG